MASSKASHYACLCSACNGALKSRSTYFEHQKIERSERQQHVGNNTPDDHAINPGSEQDTLSKLASMVAIFVDNNGLSKTALDRTIKQYQSTLPQPNHFPSSYRAARQFLDPHLTPTIVYHSCINDCLIYTNDHEDASHCPFCEEPRYKTGSKNPQKTIIYICIEEQLQKLFSESNVAKLIHAGDIALENSDELKDIPDGQQWKEWFQLGGPLASSRDGAIPLGLTTDGLNPNRNPMLKRSMWPILITLLRLRGPFRNMLGFGLLLVTIVPGHFNGSEPKSLQPVFELLVNDLIRLTDVRIHNEYLKAPVAVKLRILYTVCDFPAMCKVFNTAGAAAIRACPYCTEEGTYIKELCKVVHVSNRRYLDTLDPLRQADVRFPTKEAVLCKAPLPIDPQEEEQERRKYDHLPNMNQRKKQLRDTGFHGSYTLQSMPGHDRTSQAVPDGMHTVADVIKNLMTVICRSLPLKVLKYEDGLLRNMQSEAISDNVLPAAKRRKQSKKASRSRACDSEAPLESMSQPPWELSPDGTKVADKRAQSISYTPSSSLKPCPYFSSPAQLTKMEMVIKFASENVLSYCTRGLLGEDQQITLELFCSMVAILTHDCLQKKELDSIESRLNIMLALLERDFPVWLQNITTHLLHHVMSSIRACTQQLY